MTPRSSTRRDRILGIAALAALFVGLWLAVSRGLEDDSAVPEPPATTTQRPAPTPPRPMTPRPAPFVRLIAAGAFDPEGDGRERDEEAGLAVDGRADTAWRTERYSRFFKDGVGLVLDAGRRVRVQRVIVDVPVAGTRAAIRLGNNPEGPFANVAGPRPLAGRTSFSVAERRGRYIVVWIVDLPDGEAAVIAEVRVRARG